MFSPWKAARAMSEQDRASSALTGSPLGGDVLRPCRIGLSSAPPLVTIAWPPRASLRPTAHERELVLINLLGRQTPVEIAAGLVVPSP